MTRELPSIPDWATEGQEVEALAGQPALPLDSLRYGDLIKIETNDGERDYELMFGFDPEREPDPKYEYGQITIEDPSTGVEIPGMPVTVVYDNSETKTGTLIGSVYQEELTLGYIGQDLEPVFVFENGENLEVEALGSPAEPIWEINTF